MEFAKKKRVICCGLLPLSEKMILRVLFGFLCKFSIGGPKVAKNEDWDLQIII